MSPLRRQVSPTSPFWNLWERARLPSCKARRVHPRYCLPLSSTLYRPCCTATTGRSTASRLQSPGLTGWSEGDSITWPRLTS